VIFGITPIFQGHLRAIWPNPGDVFDAVGGNGAAGEEAAAAKQRVGPGDREHLLGELEQIGLRRIEVPIQPAQLVVLAVGVVVALLGARYFVAVGNHRHALREGQRGQHVLHHALTQA
jgi:hypothetical protein